MDKKDVLEKEIDLIQNCISRMSQNSFNIKGWLIALLLATIALLPETINIIALCFIIIVITFIFWYLDAFFLKIETLYRWKYNWVIVKRTKSAEFVYNLNPSNKHMWLLDSGEMPKKEPSILGKMFSKTLWPFYLPIIILAFMIIFTQDSTHQFFIDIFKLLKLHK